MRVFLIVLDGVGAGELPDADRYGDRGSHTLRHVAEHVGGLAVPTLESLGLGRVAAMPGVRALADPRGAFGRMAERSAGKDSTTGHWEMMGIVLDQPFPTYPQGFPIELLERWSERVGRGWLGNVAASGTEIIQRLGEEHQRTGRLIVYTSADSVFQVAAHEETVPLEELYDACRAARVLLTGGHAVGRVIARPFVGAPGGYRRTPNRRDFSLEPFESTVLDRLTARNVRVVTVGKVDDLFAGRGVSDAIHTKSNEEGEQVLLDLARRTGEGLVFANLVDFDTQYGHRNDPAGFATALERFDERLRDLLSQLRDDEMAWVTADHGNDPTTPSTDHSREYVPLLAAGPRVRAGLDLGTRSTFADLGATLAEMFGVTAPRQGTSFLRELRA
ncbi:MAG TPA: phosphopentomutase [Candidatus Acidoferrales bacterium]|nr:phosphopentomutase [Candidatus Acidoferrales bacterium]